MSDKQKKSWGARISSWLPNLYYVGTLVSLCFILAQAYYAKQSIIESSEWEKAKMTVDNAEKFKQELQRSPLAKGNILALGDSHYPDFSTNEGWNASEPLRIGFWNHFEDKDEARKEFFRLLEVLDSFAYPIIMGYANESGSFNMVARLYYSYSAFIMPDAFREMPNIGHHAKLLYRLWRIRSEKLFIQTVINTKNEGTMREIPVKSLLYYGDKDVSFPRLEKYQNTLDQKIKEMKKEIERFRKKAIE